MPVQYSTGIVAEHLSTRKQAGLFDVSHMGRFVFRKHGALSFLQHVLTNNAAALEPGTAQYTMIQNQGGGALDDAYLYRFFADEYLLVVNAANAEKDWNHFQAEIPDFPDVELVDQTEKLSMLSIQGPISRQILSKVLDDSTLPEPSRNNLRVSSIDGVRVLVARTGYTGEPLGFELFVPRASAVAIWQRLIECGAVPVGLGARDSLRLEAGLPLFGHELGVDPEGKEIPLFSCRLARFAVSFSALKGDFIGRAALLRQFQAFERIIKGDYADIADLPRQIRTLSVRDRGIARAGAVVYKGEDQVGWVTSGTMIPFWQISGKGIFSRISDESAKRAICLALIDSRIQDYEEISIDLKGRRVRAVVAPFLLRSEAPPSSRSILYGLEEESGELPEGQIVSGKESPLKRYSQTVHTLLQKAIDNTKWRQQECINLIPSEQTQSPMVRLLSIMDPAFRYGEHKKIKAFSDVEVFYYQGTSFIAEVETLVVKEIGLFLGCREVETRVISGQMANMAVFSAMVDYLNRGNRKQEQRRIRAVMNNHILKGGHLSAQPMGALRDYVARDPQTEMPAVINIPMLAGNPYKVDTGQVRELLQRHKPELVILGKSMIIHPEPVAEIRSFVNDLDLDTIIMYDMAHVIGLAGPYFQEPFKDGADFVTGSTHKTFFGTQRGIVAADYDERDFMYPLWEAVERRAFPGSVSNHHLGTLLGLLISAYEMNCFKDVYQKQVLQNAKAFASALKETGLDVAGDPEVSFTETHQVLVNVGYAKGCEAAKNLEDNNLIVNFQAAPEEEGFTASGLLRMGVAEMTRFGMKEKDFQIVAQFIHDVVVESKQSKQEVIAFRKKFQNMRYCFSEKEYEEKLQEIHSLI